MTASEIDPFNINAFNIDALKVDKLRTNTLDINAVIIEKPYSGYVTKYAQPFLVASLREHEYPRLRSGCFGRCTRIGFNT